MHKGRVGAALAVGLFAAAVACAGGGGGGGGGGVERADSDPIPGAEQTAKDDVQRRTTACLEAKGMVVVNLPDGGQQVKAPDGVEPLPAIRECDEQLRAAGILPDPNAPVPAEVLRSRYRDLLKMQECMKSHGYPTGQPPSVEGYGEDGGSWHPYDAVLANRPVQPNISEANGAGPDPGRLFRDCPDK